MKAALFNRYGSTDVLEVKEIEKPVPQRNEVLIRVAACSINPRDIAIRNGDLKFLTGNKFPKLTAADFSGKVEAIGQDVKKFNTGTDVFGYIQSVKKGCAAEYIAVPEKWIAKKGYALQHTVAAAIPCTYMTALQGLRNKANIKEGDEVLIYGASGGVGTAAIQLAKYYKANVTAVCSSANVAFCRQQGADQVWCYDEHNIFQRRAQFEIFFQVYSKDGLMYKQGKHLLKRRGTYITLIPSPQVFVRSVLNKLTGEPALKPVLVKADRNDLEFLAYLAKQKVLQPQVTSLFELDEIKEAHSLIETNHARGKVVVTM